MSSPAKLQEEWGKGWGKIKAHQESIARAKGFVHQLGPYDRITSRYIPLALSAAAAVLCARGVYHMVLGIGNMSSVKAVAEAWSKGWPKIVAQQKVIQETMGKTFVHRSMPGDRLTSQVIPLALTAAATALLVPGMYSMILGINKNE